MPRKSTQLADLLGITADQPEQLALLAEAGYAWLDLGHLEHAEQVFRGLTLLAANDPTGFLGLAEVLLSRDDHEPALQALDAAVRAMNTTRRAAAYAYYLQGCSQMARGQAAQAAESWRLAQSLDPSGMGRAVAEPGMQTSALSSTLSTREMPCGEYGSVTNGVPRGTCGRTLP